MKTFKKLISEAKVIRTVTVNHPGYGKRQDDVVKEETVDGITLSTVHEHANQYSLYVYDGKPDSFQERLNLDRGDKVPFNSGTAGSRTIAKIAKFVKEGIQGGVAYEELMKTAKRNAGF